MGQVREAVQIPIRVIRPGPVEDRRTTLLGQLGPDARPAVATLTAALKSGNKAVRLEAAIALSKIDRRAVAAIPVLLEAVKEQVLPKSPIAAAITYTTNQWQALNRYTEAGSLAIDNNASERINKIIAISRKNWLFVGSPQGGETAAVLFSITATCRRLGMDALAYLRDVLARLPTQRPDHLDGCFRQTRDHSPTCNFAGHYQRAGLSGHAQG